MSPEAALDVAAANIGDVRDPHAGYARARRAHPVARVEHLGAQVVMVYRYAEAEQVLRDGETFSAAINGRWMRPFLGRTILEMDGREHFTHRRLIGHAFRPRAVAAWEQDLLRPTAHELLDGIAPRGAAELVRDFTWQLPVRVFAKILGVPEVDYERWQQWAIALETAAVDWSRAVSASEEIRAYFEPVLDERRRDPGADLLSDLAGAEIEGERLDDEIIHGFIRLLVPAGAGTTYRLLGNLLYGLLTDREQLEAVRADHSLVPSAVEEALRWESPVQFAAREATRDAELGGVPVPKGSAITVALGSANRDEERFQDPDRFDVRRGGEHLGHLAFGDGAHRCLGEHLARLEAAVATDALLDRLEDVRLDAGDLDPHVVGFAFRSPTCLPVTFRAP